MSTSTSVYSGGCESGWTMYLDQFSSSADQYNRSMPLDSDRRSKGTYAKEEEEDEDSSMLSDASSGLPHFHQNEDSSEEIRYNCTIISTSGPKNGKQSKKVKDHRNKQQNFHLDDTASSPFQSFSKNNVVPNKKHLRDHGSGFSLGSTFQGKNCTEEALGFLKPSVRGNAD